MELAKNGSLHDIIKSIMLNNGPLQYTNTSRQIILAGVSRGMKYLHDRGIIHRDLKAGNILVDENFHHLITDFGMSKFSDAGHSRSQSQYGGTISYMAPEIIKNEKYYFKVDVYAFGILMFEIVSDSFSYPEFEKGEISDFAFRIKVANEKYRPKFVVPVKKSLKNLIEACWSDDTNKRPTFGEIFDKLSSNSEEYLLDDVDIDEFNLYVEDINETIDSTEKLLNQISKLEAENQKLKKKAQKISEKNSELKEEIQSVKNENKKFQTKISALKEKNQKISKENSELKEEIQSVKNENEKCQTKISALEEENQRLKKENEKYQKEINQTSKIKEEKSYQLYFLIDDKYEKKFNSSNKVSDIIKYIINYTCHII